MKKTKKVQKKSIKKAPAKVAKVAAEIQAPKNSVGIMPLGDRVLVRPLTMEESGKTTTFGIIIPDTVDKSKPDQGIVVAVGPGKRNEAGERMHLDVKEGDRVYFAKPWNEPVKIDGKEYYVIGENDIFAVLNN